MEQAAAACEELRKNIQGRSATATKSRQMLSSATPEEVNVQQQNTPQEKEVKEPHQGLSSKESPLQEEEATEEAAPKGDGSNQELV